MGPRLDNPRHYGPRPLDPRTLMSRAMGYVLEVRVGALGAPREYKVNAGKPSPVFAEDIWEPIRFIRHKRLASYLQKQT